MTDRIVALVPMRHDSERVPGKNYRPFDGRPLYHHVVDSLLACPSISTVAIDTDSEIIAADAAATHSTRSRRTSCNPDWSGCSSDMEPLYSRNGLLLASIRAMDSFPPRWSCASCGPRGSCSSIRHRRRMVS